MSGEGRELWVGGEEDGLSVLNEDEGENHLCWCWGGRTSPSASRGVKGVGCLRGVALPPTSRSRDEGPCRLSTAWGRSEVERSAEIVRSNVCVSSRAYLFTSHNNFGRNTILQLSVQLHGNDDSA